MTHRAASGKRTQMTHHAARGLNIWTTFGVWLLRTLGGPPSTGENCVILNNIYLLFY